MQTITIELPKKTTTYPITIGNNILEKLPSLVEITTHSKVIIITDENLQQLWLPKLLRSFQQQPYVIVLPAGEKSKNIHSVEVIWNELQTVGCDRKSLVINLGGGVIGDIGGFAASTYMRGVDFMQIPTSLLAAVDESIGGKTGIDFAHAKNLVGTFQQPRAVIIDVAVLQTLPQRELISGFAEVIKHGLIQDAHYFHEVTSKKPEDFSPDEMIDIIARSCEIKAAIVTQDEKEQGMRNVVNFGHTIGHALEALSWNTSTPLSHGEAVALGMIGETEISQQLGLVTHEEQRIIRQKIKDAGLPLKVAGISVDNVMKKIRSEKKNISGKIQWVLLQGIGNVVYNQTVEEGIVVRAIEEVLA